MISFEEWWKLEAPKWYVSDPPPSKGWMVDLARAAWNFATEQERERCDGLRDADARDCDRD